MKECRCSLSLATISLQLPHGLCLENCTPHSGNVDFYPPPPVDCFPNAGEFTMWSGTNFQFETIIQAHETPVRTLTFTHNGNFLVSGDDGGTVRAAPTAAHLSGLCTEGCSCAPFNHGCIPLLVD